VEWRFCQVWSKWLLIVASEMGVFFEGLQGETGKFRDMSSGGTADGSIGMEGDWLVHVQFPEFGFWGTMTLKDNDIIVADGDVGGGEGNVIWHCITG